ncbi:hypothetical protein Salat_2994800 [Sesamum alatum]|uniref:Uncharacterized protein n=1 Tax=Sesamum alatum TaxID=300844 RepID=A0AAE2C7P9_9LAMI|nr:hypothetical protein Salat_2994800 [Sesamum alatum]
MRPPASIYPGTSVLRFVRTTPVTVLGSSHAGDGVGEECYLVDPASSHMLVSKIKPCMCCARASAGAGQPARASAGLGQAARAPVGSRGVSCARGGRQACAHSRPLPPSRFFRQVAKTLILKGGVVLGGGSGALGAGRARAAPPWPLGLGHPPRAWRGLCWPQSGEIPASFSGGAIACGGVRYWSGRCLMASCAADANHVLTIKPSGGEL